MKKIIILIFLLFSITSFSKKEINVNEDLSVINIRIEKLEKETDTVMGKIFVQSTRYYLLDSLLIEYYNILLDELGGQQRIKLEKSQQNWGEFREREFQFYKDFYKEDDMLIFGEGLAKQLNEFVEDRIRMLAFLIEGNRKN